MNTSTPPKQYHYNNTSTDVDIDFDMAALLDFDPTILTEALQAQYTDTPP